MRTAFPSKLWPNREDTGRAARRGGIAAGLFSTGETRPRLQRFQKRDQRSAPSGKRFKPVPPGSSLMQLDVLSVPARPSWREMSGEAQATGLLSEPDGPAAEEMSPDQGPCRGREDRYRKCFRSRLARNLSRTKCREMARAHPMRSIDERLRPPVCRRGEGAPGRTKSFVEIDASGRSRARGRIHPAGIGVPPIDPRSAR